MIADRETEFTHDGVDYVAVPGTPALCSGCAFEKKIGCSKLGLPSCHSANRKDKTSVIFVVK